MWLSGGGERSRWQKHRFLPGQLLEGAVRDNAGHAQGTILVEVLTFEETNSRGHWFVGKYVLASDAHFRWWMSEGAGAELADRCRYHCCEGVSIDCKEAKRGQAIHLEKFRVIGEKELREKVPSWAFTRALSKALKPYTKDLGPAPKDKADADELPWAGPGDSDEGSESLSSSDEEGVDLKESLRKARDQVKKMEARVSKHLEKKKKKRAEEEGKPKEKKKKKVVGSPAESSGDGEGRRKKSKKKRKRKSAPDSPGGTRREAGGGASRKKRRQKSKDDDSSAEDDGQLFGERDLRRGERSPDGEGKDRGPFGGGDLVNFRERDDSDEESFREAPTERKATSQLQLVRYARTKPGRLASRMLLKMVRESAHGSVGAMSKDSNRTPPAAVHYLLTVMLPKLQSKVNLRSERELRTLCTAVDMLAQQKPAHAADLLSQRIKALEKASKDGHWASAQWLELLSPEEGGLLERDEEVYMSKDYLLDMKLRGYESQRKGNRFESKGDREKGGKKGKEKGRGKGKEKEKAKESTG